MKGTPSATLKRASALLVGRLEVDLVATLFGDMTMLSRAIYVLVSVAAFYGLYVLTQFSSGT